jgi:hypothetical protein
MQATFSLFAIDPQPDLVMNIAFAQSLLGSKKV